MTKELLKLTLEAIELHLLHHEHGCVYLDPVVFKIKDALQEPVAWMVYTQDGQSVYVTDNPTDIQEGQRALPLYTKAQYD